MSVSKVVLNILCQCSRLHMDYSFTYQTRLYIAQIFYLIFSFLLQLTSPKDSFKIEYDFSFAILMQ